MKECVIAISGRTLKAINFEKVFCRRCHVENISSTTASDVKGRRLTILMEGEELFIKQTEMPKVRKKLIGKLARNQLYAFIKDINRVIFSFKIPSGGSNMEIMTYCFNWLDIDLFKDMSLKNRIRSICFMQEVLMEMMIERHAERNFIMIAQCNHSTYLVISRDGIMIYNRVICNGSIKEVLETTDVKIHASKSPGGTDRKVMYLINMIDDELEGKYKDSYLLVKEDVSNEEIYMHVLKKGTLDFKPMWYLEDMDKRKRNVKKVLVTVLFVLTMIASEIHVFQHAQRAEVKKELQKLARSETMNADNKRKLSSIDQMLWISDNKEIWESLENVTIRGSEIEVALRCRDEDEEKRKIRLIEERMKNKVTSFTCEQNGICSFKIEAK